MVCAKGHSVGEFLAEVQRQLAPEFAELRGISSDALLFVKEDVMLPHHYTFYDLIVAQARGKSGPFFKFDVASGARQSDSRVEADEARPGKVVLQAFYERSKHIFPANRWEQFDPAADYSKQSRDSNPLA
mmetsp:Transcript_22769/g.77941  ORF Transcript_22769/g.77941 Transcript_22769/m.77941 type:complete len:130 (-) Transcript_22769:177-566(-)